MDLGPGCDVEPELGTLPRPCSLDIARENFLFYVQNGYTKLPRQASASFPMCFNGNQDRVCSLTSLKMSTGLSVVQAGVAAGHAGCIWASARTTEKGLRQVCLEALLFVLPQGSVHHLCRVSTSLLLSLDLTSLLLSLDLAGSECAASATCNHRRVQCHRDAELRGLGPGAVLSTGLPSIPGVREDAEELEGEDFKCLLEMHPHLLILERGSNWLALFDVGDEL